MSDNDFQHQSASDSESLQLENERLRSEMVELKKQSQRLQRTLSESQAEMESLKKETQTLKLSELQEAIAKQPIAKQLITATNILMYVGGFIILAGYVIFAGINWNGWSSQGKFLTAILLSLVLYGLSASTKRLIPRSVMISIACLVLPLAISLGIYEAAGSKLGLLVSLASLVCYFTLSLVIKVSILQLFVTAAGVVFYYYLLLLIGVDSSSSAISLLFLLPALIYLGIGAYFENKTVGDFKYFYFSGVFVFFAALLQWGERGSFIHLLTAQDQQGLSLVLVAMLFLVTAVVLENLPLLKKFYISEYACFFYFFGTFLLLGSLFGLSLGGEKIFYETVLLIGSLAFISTSVWKQSRIFLYGGTLFLIVYVFTIAGKYFSNKIGWPLAVLIAGLAAVLMGWMRKKYFPEAESQ